MRLREPELVIVGAEPPIQSLGVVVEDGLLEGGLAEDPLEDLVVVVHPPHDGIEEGAVEDEPEVREAVVAGAGGALLVGGPRLLELVEEQLIGIAESRGRTASFITRSERGARLCEGAVSGERAKSA